MKLIGYMAFVLQQDLNDDQGCTNFENYLGTITFYLKWTYNDTMKGNILKCRHEIIYSI